MANDPLTLVIKKYTGKVDGKSTYATIGYVDPEPIKDANGNALMADDGSEITSNTFKLNIKEVEAAIASYRKWEQEKGREPGNILRLNVYENTKFADRVKAEPNDQGRGF